MNDFDSFVNNFNIVDNALQMRDLVRWNGRDLRKRENLAEHTHLVVACAIELLDDLFADNKSFYLKNGRVSFENVIRHCMLHDSLELLRGDILSVTKDAIPGLRKFTDEEEEHFRDSILKPCSDIEMEIVALADLKACYKFVERELRYPSNDFALNVYNSTKCKFDRTYEDFKRKHNLTITKSLDHVEDRFKKGYAADAGVDIILDDDVVVPPMTTIKVDLNVNITPPEGFMAVLCARTSAAVKGLCVAMCPIDANYRGNVTAIIHNVSNSILTYKKGEAFCQAVTIPIDCCIPDVKIKKEGIRDCGKLGSTGI